MAETFLFNIAERVLAKIGNLSVDEVRLALNIKTDLKKLEDTMISIKAVLLDAERQQHQNEKLRLCMWKLRDIFYDAENVIDDFKCEALRKQDGINHPVINNLKVRVLERIVEQIIGLTVDEVRLAFNVKTDLQKLEDTMFSIKAVLLDAERQQHQNEKLRLCIWKLRNIFYDAENVIDD
ncbi:hypothetical protein Gotur_023384, partial [Gossypium turneri]